MEVGINRYRKHCNQGGWDIPTLITLHGNITHNITYNTQLLIKSFPGSTEFPTQSFCRLILQKVLTGAGEKWSEEEASQLLEDLMKYDTNGDGKFDYMGEIFHLRKIY